MRRLNIGLVFSTLMLIPGAAGAADVRFAYVGEISGSIAVSGGNFRDGIILAVEEINAKGGILKEKIALSILDTQTNPGVARSQMQKAIDGDPYVILGPIFSGNVKSTMPLLQKAEIPHLVGGEAAAITSLGNPYLFRTSFTQDIAMPKIATYIKDTLKAKTVAVIYVNNDFGKGGRDVIVPEFDCSSASRWWPTSPPTRARSTCRRRVLKAKQSNADALFVYLHEEESARILRELRKQGYDKPIVGETTLANEKVIELAGDAANGIVAHVGLTADAPNPNSRVRRALRGRLQVQAGPQRDEGLLRHVGGQGAHRQGGQGRHQGARAGDARPDDHAAG